MHCFTPISLIRGKLRCSSHDVIGMHGRKRPSGEIYACDLIDEIKGTLLNNEVLTEEDPQGYDHSTYYIYGQKVTRGASGSADVVEKPVSVAENLFALDTGLHNEVVRATAAEGDLTTLKEDIKKTNLVDALNAEYDRATVAEYGLYQAVLAEEARAKGVEGDLANLSGNAAKPAGSTAETWTLVDAINGVDTAAVQPAPLLNVPQP